MNITCSMAVSSKSGNTKLVADALQRELSGVGVRFAATFDLVDGAAADLAQSEGVESTKGAEGDEAVENGQSANAAASAPVESTSSTSTIATQASEADVVFVGFWCDKGSCNPAVQHFLQGLAGKRVFLFGTCGFGESDEYFAQILDRVRTYLPADAQYIGGAMCQGKMGMGVKRRYEGMLEKDPENAQARMLIDNWNKAQSHPNEDDVSRIAAAAKEALEGISE
ncbi:flavodoxin family protein BilS [uncultured Slackia sp.]|uniref:flavodoxin family protein BilS n=1 Tax=uncultured Slackia sp. TaxID=665903 RepID=UPI00267610AE|nr:flavodoxin family protein BilS [uncultured Slackia sp.]